MYMPRRHYRRLLLPPGWVALGFLLLLGCQLVVKNRTRVLPENVVQLTMPVLEKVAEEKYKNVDPYVYLFAKPLARIKTATHWQDATFIGKPYPGSMNKARVEAMVLATQADFGHARGIRIRLGKGATYSNLVSLLDVMMWLNQKKYWLDIEHQPTTFYVVNDKAVKTSRIMEARMTYQ
jgi:hypothetical protein